VTASAKEAPAEYESKTLVSANSDQAFNASKAIQQMVETILMFTDIFIPLQPKLACPERAARYTD